ncbi:hypothetical protein [Paraflavitalea speifideaquila]|uniref:hypothetical protein n=1 Tax=Paraflavitalea speifideaquila TaxID=3076558 RepID=UPI0028E3AD78|nr:hypothetical protein [Paraflavitalea speifideiaquila]
MDRIQKDPISASGWSTLAGLLAIKPDHEIDLKEIKQLLERVEKTIHKATNRTRHTMNAFVIAVGGYMPALTAQAIATGKRLVWWKWIWGHSLSGTIFTGLYPKNEGQGLYR